MKKIRFFIIINLISIIFSFCFISNVSSHPNDIDFNFLNAVDYSDDYPDDFNVDENLNLTYYNNADYLEHTKEINSFNQSYNSYPETITLNTTYEIVDIYYKDDLYYMYDDSVEYFRILDKDFNFIKSEKLLDTPSLSSYAYITSNSTNFILITILDGIGKAFVVLDINFNFIKYVLIDEDITFIPAHISYNNVNNRYYVLDDFNNHIDVYTPFFTLDFSIDKFGSDDLICMKYSNHQYMLIDYVLDKYRVYNNTFHLIEEFDITDGFGFGATFGNGHVLSDLTNELLKYQSYQYLSNNDGLFENVNNININSTINMSGRLEENYKGSESFQNDKIGDESTNINFIEYDASTSNSGVEIIEKLGNHRRVLKCHDMDNTEQFNVVADLEGERISGDIEFYFRIDEDLTGTSYIHLKQSGTSNGITIYWIAGILYFYDGGFNSIGNYIKDTWYHYNINFNVSTDWHLWINNISIDLGVGYSYWGNPTFIRKLNLISTLTSPEINLYFDAFGFSWDANYDIGDNLEFEYLENDKGYSHYSFEFLNETHYINCNIEYRNSSIYVNNIDVGFNIYDDYNYNYNSYKQQIYINQYTEKSFLCLYNSTNNILFNESLIVQNYDNIKYVRYRQYFQDSYHCIYVNNLSITSNNTRITSNVQGFVSYKIENILNWNTNTRYKLNLKGYGRYRIYLSSSSFDGNVNNLYPISNYVDFEGNLESFDLSTLNYIVSNPYIILECSNGHYILTKIEIITSLSNYTMGDSLDNIYIGEFTSGNVGDESYFRVENNKLYFNLRCNDFDEEYIKLHFNIDDIDNLNYQIIYKSKINTSDVFIKQFNIKHTDASYVKQDLAYLVDVNDIQLNQEKTTSFIEFYVSDNDLYDNNTISGYVEYFRYDYVESLNLDLFFNIFIGMMIPLMVILALTFSISSVLSDNNINSDIEKESVFPLIVLSSFICFIMSILDGFTLFVIILATISYILKKKKRTINDI